VCCGDDGCVDIVVGVVVVQVEPPLVTTTGHSTPLHCTTHPPSPTPPPPHPAPAAAGALALLNASAAAAPAALLLMIDAADCDSGSGACCPLPLGPLAIAGCMGRWGWMGIGGHVNFMCGLLGVGCG
jgi:hypothetical protein